MKEIWFILKISPKYQFMFTKLAFKSLGNSSFIYCTKHILGIVCHLVRLLILLWFCIVYTVHQMYGRYFTSMQSYHQNTEEHVSTNMLEYIDDNGSQRPLKIFHKFFLVLLISEEHHPYNTLILRRSTSVVCVKHRKSDLLIHS